MRMKLKILPPRPIGPHDRDGKALARLWRRNRRSWHRLMLPAVPAFFYEALVRFAKESPSARLVELERSTVFTDLPTAAELGEAREANVERHVCASSGDVDKFLRGFLNDSYFRLFLEERAVKRATP